MFRIFVFLLTFIELADYELGLHASLLCSLPSVSVETCRLATLGKNKSSCSLNAFERTTLNRQQVNPFKSGVHFVGHRQTV